MRRAGSLAITLVLLAAGLSPVPGPAKASAQPSDWAAPGQIVAYVSPTLLNVAERASPAVVSVRGTESARRRDRAHGGAADILRQLFPNEFQDRGAERGRSRSQTGSGFIVRPNGYIVTNHHVVDDTTSIEVTLGDGRVLNARLVGSDPDTDLALLKVDATRLPIIPLGTSADLKIGELMLALGKPPGQNHTVMVGSLTGGADRHAGVLQTDAGITADVSGGPLLDARGEVVGVSIAIAPGSGTSHPVGFAIPIDRAKAILRELQDVGRAGGWLGLVVQPVTRQLARSLRLRTTDGVVVASVEPGSPAGQAGLRPGDVILRFDGIPVNTPEEFAARLTQSEVGRFVELNTVRDGRPWMVRAAVGRAKYSQ